MPTPYEKIYENLLPKFKSYKIPLMTEEEVKEYLHDYSSDFKISYLSKRFKR